MISGQAALADFAMSGYEDALRSLPCDSWAVIAAAADRRSYNDDLRLL